jgi:hypothetical protein
VADFRGLFITDRGKPNGMGLIFQSSFPTILLNVEVLKKVTIRCWPNSQLREASFIFECVRIGAEELWVKTLQRDP